MWRVQCVPKEDRMDGSWVVRGRVAWTYESAGPDKRFFMMSYHFAPFCGSIGIEVRIFCVQFFIIT